MLVAYEANPKAMAGGYDVNLQPNYIEEAATSFS